MNQPNPPSLTHPPPLPPQTSAEYIRSRGLWILLVFLLVAPLAFLRSLTPLRFAGVFTALAVAYFAASVVASYALPSLDACSVYQTPSPCPLDLAAVATAPPGVIARLLQVPAYITAPSPPNSLNRPY